VRPVPAETSPLAIVSLVCGILAFVAMPFLAAIPAVVCGHLARSRISQAAGRVGGKGLALAGLIMGYLNLALLPVIAILAALAIPVFSKAQERAVETRIATDARQIALACLVYASDHGDAFPPKLEDLVPDYLPDRSLLENPRHAGGFIYFGGTTKDPAKKVLLHSAQPNRRGGRVTAFVDGSVETNHRPDSKALER
jgi:type II secretory pathway pseudopilin PulG